MKKGTNLKMAMLIRIAAARGKTPINPNAKRVAMYSTSIRFRLFFAIVQATGIYFRFFAVSIQNRRRRKSYKTLTITAAITC